MYVRYYSPSIDLKLFDIFFHTELRPAFIKVYSNIYVMIVRSLIADFFNFSLPSIAYIHYSQIQRTSYSTDGTRHNDGKI